MAKASRSTKGPGTISAPNGVAPDLVTPNGSPVVRNKQRKDTDGVPSLQITSSTDSAEATVRTTTRKKSAAVVTPITEAPKRKKRAVVIVSATRLTPKKGSSTTKKAAKTTQSKKVATPAPTAAKKTPTKVHKKSNPKKHRRRTAVLSAMAAAGATVLYSKMAVDWNVTRSQQTQGVAEKSAAGSEIASKVGGTVRKAQDVVMQTVNQTAAWSSNLAFVLRPKDTTSRPKDTTGSTDEELPAKGLRGIALDESAEKEEEKKTKIPGLSALNKKVQGFDEFMKNIVDEDSDVLFL